MPTGKACLSLQAAWQALQPMHLVTSMSFATSAVCRCCGLGIVVAAKEEANVRLEPGDVILTGTPEGVAPLAPGQTLEVRIEKVGSLSVRVEKEGATS